MSQINFHQVFTNKFLEFLVELKTTFPEVTDFEMYENLTRTSVMFNEELPLTLFKSSVEQPFGKYIDNKDDSFIYDDSIFKNTDDSFVKILKMIWKDLDETNKNHVWKHIQLLLAISRKVQ